jgi:hypothetical protein
MAKQAARRARPKNRPEKKIGPFAGGIGVAIWVNRVETDNGPRDIRSITIAPRRYKDQKSGEWRDATSFRAADLPALIFALTKAQEHVFATPLPGETGQRAVDDVGDQDIPF